MRSIASRFHQLNKLWGGDGDVLPPGIWGTQLLEVSNGSFKFTGVWLIHISMYCFNSLTRIEELNPRNCNRSPKAVIEGKDEAKD